MIHVGDCIEVMRTLPAESVDSVCTDPPYGLGFMSKQWDTVKAQDTPLARFRTGKGPAAVAFDGHAFQAWCTEWGREAIRVTKPGGYLLAFGGTRTHHRLVCGLEDAGWIIRDELTWVYASGFPKGKANLKPAHEPIVLARKPGPLRPLAIDACRIGTGDDKDDARWYEWQRGESSMDQATGMFQPGKVAPRPADWYERDAEAFGRAHRQTEEKQRRLGRWPSNLLLQDPELFDTANPYVVGSGAVTSSGVMAGGTVRKPDVEANKTAYGLFGGNATDEDTYGDTGGYSRFFIIPKADRADREPVLRPEGHEKGKRFSTHPTVKPVDLMRHLVRLVTPPGGTVLDCFLGSGSTAIAAEMEGLDWIGIEKEADYVAIAEARLNGIQKGLGLAT